MRGKMPRDNGFNPNHDYSWLHKIEKPSTLPQQILPIDIFHAQQMEKVIAMYDAIQDNFDEAFQAFDNDPICQKVMEQVHLDHNNKLTNEDMNVYEAILHAYERAFGTNFDVTILVRK